MSEVVLIENWSVVTNPDDPEPKPLYFHGMFSGHPNHPEEHEATSSRILGYKEDGEIFVCRSRCYRLGSIDPKWVQEQPGVSLEKLKENLPRM